MATTAGQKPLGSIIKLNENGVPADFIVVQQGNPNSSIYDSSWNNVSVLVRKNCVTHAWNNTNNNDYVSSEIDTWLNNTYYNSLDSAVRSIIVTVKWPYWDGTGNSGSRKQGANGLARRIALPSLEELGLSHGAIVSSWTAISSSYQDDADNCPSIGSRFAWFDQVADVCQSNEKRKSVLDNGGPIYSWVRDPDRSTGTSVWNILSGGSFMYWCTQGATTQHGNRPVFCIPSSTVINDDGTIPLPPSVPPSISVPALQGGESALISWGASTDPNGDLAGYELELKKDSGSFTNIYRGSNTSTYVNVPFGVQTITLRVRAYDNSGHYGGYTTSRTVTITNQNRPTTPPSITVPTEIKGGEPVTITWETSTDADNNLLGHVLERSYDGASYEQAYRGTALNFTETIPKGTESVRYRVAGYDTYNAQSDWQTSPLRSVTNNTPPVVTTEQSADAGQLENGLSFSYTVDDEDADQALTVTEYVDSSVLRTFEAERDTEYTFDLSGNDWKTTGNGSHTASVTVSDGESVGQFIAIFTKNVTECTVTLAEGLAADAPISACALAISGSIPEDAELLIEVTNNFGAEDEVWEDATAAVQRGFNHVFTNTTTAPGVFNFRINAGIGKSGTGGFLSGIQGGFE